MTESFRIEIQKDTTSIWLGAKLIQQFRQITNDLRRYRDVYC